MKVWILFILVAVGLCGRCKNNRYSSSTMMYTSTAAMTNSQEPSTTSIYKPSEATDTTTPVVTTSPTEERCCFFASIPQNCPEGLRCSPLDDYIVIEDSMLRYDVPVDLTHTYVLTLYCNTDGHEWHVSFSGSNNPPTSTYLNVTCINGKWKCLNDRDPVNIYQQIRQNKNAA